MNLRLFSWDHLDLPCLPYPTGAIVVLAHTMEEARTVARARLEQRFPDREDGRAWFDALDGEPDVHEAPVALLFD